MAPEDNRPFPIQLEVEFLDRLSEPVREGKAKSVSAIIRAALERFDLSSVVVVRPSQLLVSVRLPAAIRAELKKAARSKHTSVGQLVRAAVEAYLPQLESDTAGQLEMPIPHVELPEEVATAAALETKRARPPRPRSTKKKPTRRETRSAAPARKRSPAAKSPSPKKSGRSKRVTR
ncbi:MAG: hypothetical protein C0518_03415 [Opitutus sp.]|nr:hypothetical protein [Opitutus sp.]